MAQIPSDLQQYKSAPLFSFPQKLRFTIRSSSSYLIDPQWARKFTIVWTSVLAAGVAVSLPHLYKSVRQGRALTGVFGVTESWKTNQYFPVEEKQLRKREKPQNFVGIGISRARAILAWTLPGFDVSVGQSEFYFFSRLGQISHGFCSATDDGVLRHLGELHPPQIRTQDKLQ